MTSEIEETAARWHVAQADDDMDWLAFTEWLEADPRHRHAYDAIALLDTRIDAARLQLSRAFPSQAAAQRGLPKAAYWGALAAILLVVLGIGGLRLVSERGPQTVAYQAPIGASRSLALPGGSSATLAPGSVLHIGTSRETPMTLEGKAFFDVRHDPSQSMVVRAGGYEIRDIGTRFEVLATDRMIRVAVAEGRVALRSSERSGGVEIGAGKALTVTRTGAIADVRPANASAIGAWRQGPLAYDDVPLAMVAADIARATGQAVTIDPSISRRRFSGVIATGDRATMVASLSALAGLKMRMEGDAVRLDDGTRR